MAALLFRLRLHWLAMLAESARIEYEWARMKRDIDLIKARWLALQRAEAAVNSHLARTPARLITDADVVAVCVVGGFSFLLIDLLEKFA